MSSFENFCGSTFWNNSLSWNTKTDPPDLTECFQETVLIWVPCAFLWLSLPVYVYNLCSTSSDSPTPVNKLHVAKIVTGVLLAALALCDVIKYVVESQQGQKPPLTVLVSPVILSVTLIVSVLVMIWERKKGFITSGVQFVFYFILLIAGTFRFASRAIELQSNPSDEEFRTVTFFAFYFLNLLMFLLQCFAEKHPDLEADPKTCPEVKSSFLSRLVFGWITSLVLQGYRTPLTEKDLFKLNTRDKVESTVHQFTDSWRRELKSCKWDSKAALQAQTKKPEITPKQNNHDDSERTPLLGTPEVTTKVPKSSKKLKKPSLFKALAKVYGWPIVVAHIFKLISDVLTFVGPLIQSQLIDFIDATVEAKWHGYLYAILFFLVAVVQSIMMQQMFHIGMCVAMRVKGVLMYAVYKKALTISNQARKNTTVGEIVNLMSVDTDRIQMIIGYLWIVWSCPFQLVVALYMLYQLLGVAVFAGLAALLLLLPINYFVARYQQKLEVKQMSLKDNRIKLLNEVLNGIKVLKLYAWELSFKEKVDVVRNAEVANLKLFRYLGTVGVLCWTVAPFLVMLTSFATFVLMGNVLDANTAFVSLTLFNILQFPINLLPMLVSFLVTAVVSLGRLGNFLRQPDIETGNVTSTGDDKNRIEIQRGTFAWGTDENDIPALKDISFKLDDGSLVAIVGLVGSGKSSMISAMLGEMEKLEGSVVVNGSIAYVAQQAWIQNATLRDNILFGKPFDEEKYRRVIDACALTTDLEILTAGDMTEIGEKGINLSGGQKQRVALARAVYQDLDIYLFDDPLSAVDAHVGKHIYENVVGKKSILKNKTRVLVTHGVHWLPMVDKIVVMDHGLISETGSYEELMHHNGPFAQFLKTHLLKENEENNGEDDDEDDENDDPEVAEMQKAILQRIESVVSEESDTNINEPQEKRKMKRRISRQLSMTAKPVTKEDAQKELQREEKRKAEEKLIADEESETGRVKLSVIISYIKALGLFNSLAIILMYTAYQGASIFGNIWLTSWTADPILSNSSILPNSSDFIETRDMYLGIYGASGIAQAIFVLIYSLILAYASIRASFNLHSAMLFSVLRSPMSFFDTTPIGRILNRFSRDIESVDNQLPDIFVQVAASGYTVLASFFVISFSTPFFLALLVPITILYYLIQRFFIPASRQMKRLESNTRSPVYAHFSESVSGAATIRAFKKEKEFEEKSNQLVEHNMVYYFANISSNRWLNFRLDLLGGLVIIGAALFAVIEKDSTGGITGSVAGLSLSYALQATQELNWFVRTISEFELNIVSVERISQYVKLESEADWTKESGKALADWPSQGEIEFENYGTRYRPGLDLVVKNINLHIKPQEKIGICGRTGAGKSSLTTALFRIIESVTGNIVIDNVTLGGLGLHDLRSRLTILPQDPVLFSGTLRMNLDPFSSYSDPEVWWSLEKAHLKSFVEGLPAGLTYECGEGGQNLSVGQRQLLCLARALLRKTKVLVLDEATAAVDMETDSLIQNTIRTEFKDCTILTIAHRLNTIMDSDRILVLDKGEVAEFDTPNKLLSDKMTMLYKMAKEAGIV